MDEKRKIALSIAKDAGFDEVVFNRNINEGEVFIADFDKNVAPQAIGLPFYIIVSKQNTGRVASDKETRNLLGI